MNNDQELTVKSTYEHKGVKVVLETTYADLEDVLEAFENVLRGSGFCFDGCLDIVENNYKAEAEKTEVDNARD